MNLEPYAIHIAPRGGKIDLIVDEFNAARQAAITARQAYAASKGAIGCYSSESSVGGLMFKKDAAAEEDPALPDGWVRTQTLLEGIVAAPKAKDRTKVSRELVKAQKAELAALPHLPGAWEFTNRIGASQTLGTTDGGGFCLRNCFYERVGETTFVMTPWVTKAEVNTPDEYSVGENTGKGKRTAFHPEGCERVGLSVYYAAKEKGTQLMTLCHQCTHWRGNRAISAVLSTPENEWNFGQCDRLRRILEIEVNAGWGGGTVGIIGTPASFGCVEGKPA